MKIFAKPLSIKLSHQYYIVTAEITDGPKAMLGKMVAIEFSSNQLTAIEDWSPISDNSILMFSETEKE